MLQKKRGRIAAATAIIGIIAAGSVIFAPHDNRVTPVPAPQKSMLEQVNDVRAQAGKLPVTEDAKLDAAAQAKVNDQINRNYWAHNLPGERIGQFVLQQYPQEKWQLGENLARCQTNDRDRVQQWVNSPDHYKTMIGDYSAMGYAEKVNPNDRNCVYTVMYFIKF